MVARDYSYFESREKVKMYQDEIKVAWKNIENLWYTMELKIPEDNQENIPMFEDIQLAIEELIRIEKSWKDVNEASCRSSMDEYEDDC